jgi:uncharacterized C2H2 Zn-finger protein
MARSRRAASGEAKAVSGSNEKPETFTCPECGKTFARAASLGAHRQRAHGVAGTSKPPSRGKGRQGSSARARRSSSPSRQRTATAVRAQTQDGGVNRDALLQAIFPNGLPAREAVIRRANEWLDEAERLAATKS